MVRAGFWWRLKRRLQNSAILEQKNYLLRPAALPHDSIERSLILTHGNRARNVYRELLRRGNAESTQARSFTDNLPCPEKHRTTVIAIIAVGNKFADRDAEAGSINSRKARRTWPSSPFAPEARAARSFCASRSKG